MSMRAEIRPPAAALMCRKSLLGPALEDHHEDHASDQERTRHGANDRQDEELLNAQRHGDETSHDYEKTGAAL